jgi:transposase-like protein
MPAGRPSGYKPEFGEEVESFMEAGYSKMAAAGKIGVCYNTLKSWMEQHPEFLTAVKRGEAKRAMKLEADLLDADSGPKVTSRIFALKNAAPDEWRDKHTTEHVGKDDGPIKTESEGLSLLFAHLDAVSSRAAGSASE